MNASIASASGLVQSKNKLAVFEHVEHKSVVEPEEYYGRDSPLSSNLVIDDDQLYENDNVSRRKRFKGVPLAKEELHLECKWDGCGEQYENYKAFIQHINNDHIIHIEDDVDSLSCLWPNCEYVAPSLLCLIKHATYHGYHTKLMSIGENVVERQKLPECQLDTFFDIPEHIHDYECRYDGCNMTFLTIYDYHDHIAHHVNGNPKTSKTGLPCLWPGCSFKWTNQWGLQKHIRSHTKEKILACPKCGTLFVTVGKFIDHRNRQLPIEMQNYQCSTCTKLFPSETILMDHIRNHINHYKCSMCDMTCPKPSALARHIRYRHLDERPFKCNLCKHSSITKEHFECHLLTHCTEKIMACEACDFRCRSLCGLDSHYQKAHGEQCGKQFECHFCQKRFDRGNYLTKHLMKEHGASWPSGHSKFRYKEDGDGIYRIQTIRYETLDVHDELYISSQQETNIAKGPIKYSLVQAESSDGVLKFELKEDEDVEKKKSFILMVDETGDEKVVYNSDNNVVITVDDVDDKGNVVKTETVQTNEIICAHETVYNSEKE